MKQRLFKQRDPHMFLPVAVMLVAGVIGTYVLTRSHAQTIDPGTPPPCAKLTAAPPLPTLKRDNAGTCVSFLQWTLNHLQYTDSVDGTQTKSYALAQTGTFDAATFAAVTDFQKRLTAIRCTAQIGTAATNTTPAIDGTVDPTTWYFLTTLSGQVAYASGGYSCGPGNPLK